MLQGKPDPFKYMIEHRKRIIEILDESSTLKNAWNMLTKSLPEIVGIVKFNTFKGYVRILKVVNGELTDLTRENNKLLHELGKVRHEKDSIEIELGKVRYDKEKIEAKLLKLRENRNKASSKNSSTGEMQDHGKTGQPVEMQAALPDHEMVSFVPKRIDGWGVQLRGNYYRMFKKINGKVKWIHVGRDWKIYIGAKVVKPVNS